MRFNWPAVDSIPSPPHPNRIDYSLPEAHKPCRQQGAAKTTKKLRPDHQRISRSERGDRYSPQERMSEKLPSSGKPIARTAKVEREEFELACIREFSHSGHHLGIGVSPAERRERIRAAILREQKSNLRWRDSMWTYASAFTHAYQQPLEAGDKRAPQPWVPADDSAWDDDVADDEEELRDGV